MRFPLILSLFCVCALAAYPQVPIATGVQILKAEDARRYDVVLEKLMQSPNAAVRTRAALAAGRIGDDRAVEPLVKLLADDKVESVRAMAAFAVGEIESVKGADALELAFIRESPNRTGPGSPIVFGRVIEAAGKIVAANPKDPLSAGLREKIIYALKTRPNDSPTANLVLTAALRARPDGGAPLVAAFLDDPDAEIRADALNTLTRIRAKERLADIRGLLRRDPDPVVRANAARALGAAEDKEAFPLLLDYAVNGDDLRVRVACIRSLRSLKDPEAAKPLIDYGRRLLARVRSPNAAEKNELLEIAVVVGYLLEKTDDPAALAFLNETSEALGYRDTEVFSAITHVSPRAMLDVKLPPNLAYRDAQVASSYALGLSEIAFAKDDALTAEAGRKLAQFVGGMATGVRPADQAKMVVAMPSLTTAMAELKPDNIDEILRGQLKNDDPFVRAAAAGAIAERPRTDANVEALKSAFIIARLKDKHDNDAKLATLEALVKVDKKDAVGSLLMSLDDPDTSCESVSSRSSRIPSCRRHFPAFRHRSSLLGRSTKIRSCRIRRYGARASVRCSTRIWTIAELFHARTARSVRSLRPKKARSLSNLHLRKLRLPSITL
jgi:HEAT repeat protein